MSRQFSTAGTGFAARTFEERLGDFAPELSAFLRQAWNQRSSVVSGSVDLYDIYTGECEYKKISLDELIEFHKQLGAMHPLANIHVQDFPRPRKFTPLSKLSDGEIKLHRHTLAATFYHCLNVPTDAQNRIYVHSRDLAAGLEILQEVVRCFPRMQGICEAKISGPAMTGRADTIVIYLASQAASDELLAHLQDLHKRLQGSFAAGVPALVKEVLPGIGTSAEPPQFEILTGGGTRHSFGSFYCDLIFTALKNTPNITSPTSDGRHMLDNLAWSLQMLGIPPKDHLAFPQREGLEAFQQALKHKPAPVL